MAHAFTQTPALWRSLFLSLWDAPPHTIDDQPFDYRAAVQQRVAARTELVVAVREKQLSSALSVETLQALVETARARPSAGDFGRFSLNQDWLTTCIPSDYLSNPHPSPTRSRRMTVAPRPTEAETLAVQLAAQLHVLQVGPSF